MVASLDKFILQWPLSLLSVKRIGQRMRSDVVRRLVMGYPTGCAETIRMETEDADRQVREELRRQTGTSGGWVDM